MLVDTVEFLSLFIWTILILINARFTELPIKFIYLSINTYWTNNHSYFL